MALLQASDRRLKRCYVSKELLLNFLLSPRKYDDHVEVYIVSGIPDDCTIEAVMFDFDRDAWAVRLHHPSFDAVDENHVIPSVDITIKAERVRLADAPGVNFREFI